MIKLKNTDKAVKRLILALKNNEKIGVWSDYDPDGVFALTLAYEALLNAGFKKNNLALSLPNQHKYRRSFNKFHLKLFKKSGVKLIIGIDFGTTDFEQVGWAKKMGFEVILLDHHRQRPGNLPALLINPYQKGDDSKTKNWSGAGVAYLFFENLYNFLKIDPKKLEKSIDLILIPALTDYIQINNGNLPYLKKSLGKIKAGDRPGLNASLKQIGLNKNLAIEDFKEKRADLCDFYGTLNGNGKQNNVFNLLLSKNKKDADKISKQIKKDLAVFEKYIDSMVAQGIKKFRSANQAKKLKFIFWGTDKDMGMIATGSKIANRLNEYFRIPVYFYNKENNIMKGSVRTNYPENSDANVIDSMKSSAQLFFSFGGHPRAAGFYIKKKNLPLFEKALNKYYGNS
ncbi:MAG: DHH family phosphoesterase [bacterium]|nr:DHH family phosphoesterase [bacterium]